MKTKTKVISIYAPEDFLRLIDENMHKMGFNSRSDFFRTAARFFIFETKKLQEHKVV